MTNNEYLTQVLESQILADDSKELKELREHRADVDKLLREHFEDSSPTIRYGGSKAKGTLIKESYDLDIICYFPNDDTSAGDSLEDIYNNVQKALEKEYYVTPKNSSLRLKSKETEALARDFHIDVVPGRFIDESETDCFIHQAEADKERLKTNLDVHISHVKDSGVIDAIRLLKLWKARKSLRVKQFVWELLIIQVLEGKKSKSLEDQLSHVLTEIRDSVEPIKVEDPANPNGNDLSKIFDSGIWQLLSSSAGATLRAIESSGWESVFGTTKRLGNVERVAALTQAAASATIRTKPWSDRIE